MKGVQTMSDIIVIAIVILVVGAAVAYIIREKKKGVKCIGCPHAKECASKNCSGGCGGSQS